MLFYLFFFFKLSTGLMVCHSQIAMQSINFKFLPFTCRLRTADLRLFVKR